MTVRVGVGWREDCEFSSHRKREIAMPRSILGVGKKKKAKGPRMTNFPLVVSLRFYKTSGNKPT